MSQSFSRGFRFAQATWELALVSVSGYRFRPFGASCNSYGFWAFPARRGPGLPGVLYWLDRFPGYVERFPGAADLRVPSEAVTAHGR